MHVYFQLMHIFPLGLRTLWKLGTSTPKHSKKIDRSLLIETTITYYNTIAHKEKVEGVNEEHHPLIEPSNTCSEVHFLHH